MHGSFRTALVGMLGLLLLALAAAVMMDPAMASFEQQQVQVVTTPGAEQGRTLAGEGGAPLRVAAAADGEQFRRDFLAVLNGLTR